MLNIFYIHLTSIAVMRPAYGLAFFNQKRLLRVFRPFA